MRRLKAYFDRIPHWIQNALELLLVFFLLALSIPRLIGLSLQLSQGFGSSTQLKTPSAVGITAIPAPTFTANYPPACTRVGQQWTSPADGMALLCVPAGDFLMGSSESSANTDEHPQHKVTLSAYWIDQTDVTNAEYARCVASGTCSLPLSQKSYLRPNYYSLADYQSYPIVGVSWKQADQYCRWANRGLPTEAEWEKAARGTQGNLYPWGNSAPSEKLLNFNTLLDDTSAVCRYPAGDSPYGACDMAGNVWQWVADWYDKNEYSTDTLVDPTGPADGQYKIFRGSQWGSPTWAVSLTIRRWRVPDLWSFNLGFRYAISSALTETKP